MSLYQPDRCAVDGMEPMLLLDAAHAYAAQGLAVFPLHTPVAVGGCSCRKTDCASIGKHPRTTNGAKDATTSAKQITEWWTRWPDANIGIATGAVSGIMIVDVDGVEGEESLVAMTETLGPLPASHTVRTGRGRHLYFTHPGGKVKSKAPISNLYPHVDSRGDGGYVVAPPSRHSSGASYAGDPTAPSELADAPLWLLDLVNVDTGISTTRGAHAANDSIAEGSRNVTFASLAGTMRNRGMSQSAIEAALLAENRALVTPLPEDEVRGIARSIAKYEPCASSEVLRTLNDSGNAERFAKRWGDDVRYVPESRQWLVWNGNCWQIDAVGAVMEMAKQTASEIYVEGNMVTDTATRDAIVRHSKSSQQAPRLNAMLGLAQSIPKIALPISKLDADPWVLGVQNGTLDLRKGVLIPATREQYITKVSPVKFDHEANCPAFLDFLNVIMGGDQELVAYIQRLLGYMLTGDTREQRLFFLYGTGANGKSTLLNICKGILGSELCRQTPVETIMARGRK